MSRLLPLLSRVSYIELSCTFADPLTRLFGPAGVATLRPRLYRSALERLDPDDYETLFTPPLPNDPEALRRYQRPAPPFVLAPAGENALTVRLFGEAILHLDALLLALNGMAGDIDSTLTIEARQGNGELLSYSEASRTPRLSTDWTLMTGAPDRLRLTFVTPARLIAGNKPLFRPALRQILPFVLRRVTAVLGLCCRVEIDDPAELLAVPTLREHANHLVWEDWRRLGQNAPQAELGGLLGALEMSGIDDDLYLLLQLGALLNLGKGAACGAGAFRLDNL